MSAAPQRNTDLVPLDERLLYLRVLRAVITLATILDATLLPHLLRRPFLTVAVSAMAYLVLCLLAEGLWRLLHRPGLWLFGGLATHAGDARQRRRHLHPHAHPQQPQPTALPITHVGASAAQRCSNHAAEKQALTRRTTAAMLPRKQGPAPSLGPYSPQRVKV